MSTKPACRRYFDELYHKGGGNPWHDPKTGKFTSGPGGGSLGKLSRSGAVYEDYVKSNGRLTEKGKARLNTQTVDTKSKNNGGDKNSSDKNNNDKNNNGGDKNKNNGQIHVDEKGRVRSDDRAKAISQIEKAISQDYSDKASMYREGKNMATQGSSLLETMRKEKNRQAANSLDLSNMSDQDLRDYVNRKSLERQYRDAATAESDRGHTAIEEFLTYGGAVLGLAASAATIAATLHKLRS